MKADTPEYAALYRAACAYLKRGGAPEHATLRNHLISHIDMRTGRYGVRDLAYARALDAVVGWAEAAGRVGELAPKPRPRRPAPPPSALAAPARSARTVKVRAYQRAAPAKAKRRAPLDKPARARRQ